MAKAKRKKTARTARKCRRTRSTPRSIEIALGGLTDDIRTPLAGILALSQLLHSSDLPERERRWAIHGAADHLARLTSIVVDAAKAQSAGLVLRNEPFSRWNLPLRSPRRSRVEGKGLDVEISIAQNLPARVSGDEVRLRSALENLTGNAVKFTERGAIGFSGLGCARRARTRAPGAHREGQRHRIVAADIKRLFRPRPSERRGDATLRWSWAGRRLR